MKRFAGFLVAATAAWGAQAQLTIATNQTPAQLLTDVLLGSGVTVSNISFNGVASPATPQQGTGSFTQSGANGIGIDEGVILSSGLADNIDQAATGFQSDLLSPNYTDPDLVAISGGNINNSSVLEFDFVPVGDTIRFRYLFGSEEYPEFVCSFNDAFGFFLSGPAINGPYQNNAVNIALIPGTSTPVTIDNVNNGYNNNPNDFNCPAQNAAYYVINTGTTIVYDGHTVVLEAVYPVVCGEVHHIKLAIGDALDQAYDSGVFLEAGSFSSTPFVPSLNPGPGIVGNNTILESCYPVQIDFVRTGDTTLASTVFIDVAGTATAGVDYSPAFPSQIDFAAGQGSEVFTFNCPIDPDGTETIILTLTSQSECAGIDIVNEFTFLIESAPPLTATGFDINIQCGDTASLLTTIGGGYTPYTVTWNNAAGTGNPVGVSPTQFTQYTATVTDDCGTQTTANFGVGLIELPPINASIVGSGTLVEGCETNQINIIRPQGVQGDLEIDLVYSGTALNGSDFNMPTTITIGESVLNILVPFNPTQDTIAEPQETVTILVSFTDDCGRTVEDAVTINIVDPPPIFLDTEDFLRECSETDSLLISVDFSGGYNNSLSFVWSNGDTGPSTYVPLQVTTTYTVVATDPCGNTAVAYVTGNIDCEVIIPNVFSPNSDGVNDTWFIQGILAQENYVRVFNRWGQVVLDQKNYANNWTALDVPDGTYFYEVIVPKKPDSPYTGHVTVLRNRW